MTKKTKENVITLYMTAEESKNWRKKKKKEMDESDEESDFEENVKKPKAVLQKIVTEETKIKTSGDKIISKMFNIENADVIVIRDENKEYWYKGKDIAKILEYTDTKGALSRHVSEKYKKSYADMGSGIQAPSKIDPQTIFIDDCGLFQLVSRSKKREAEKLWRQITKVILPTLFTTGTYTMPAKRNDIENLNKSFYDDNMLSNYDNRPVVYFAYVGKQMVVIDGITKEEHVIKFGQTRKMSQRDLDEHRKFYKIFNVLGIWETLANVEVEKQIENNFESMNMLVPIKIKGKNKKKEENKREHIVLNEVHGLDYCLNMISNVVNSTVLPQEHKYHKKIRELEHKNELLEEKNKHLKEMNEQLKENIKDLRAKKK